MASAAGVKSFEMVMVLAILIAGTIILGPSAGSGHSLSKDDCPSDFNPHADGCECRSQRHVEIF